MMICIAAEKFSRLLTSGSRIARSGSAGPAGVNEEPGLAGDSACPNAGDAMTNSNKRAKSLFPPDERPCRSSRPRPML
jgi:hypothetical protein